MNCRDWASEIVEAVRAGANVPAALAAHLEVCVECREQLETERGLQTALARLQAASAHVRLPNQRKAELFREFDRVHRSTRTRRVQWAFLAAAAAVFVFALALSRPGAPTARPVGSDQIASLAASGFGDEMDMDDGGFVEVPYAPPLASGEFVKVVRTKLYAAALDRMGVAVPVGNGEFPAEVILGEDGLPRAVRVLESYQF